MSEFVYLKVPKEKFDNLLDHFCFDQTVMNGECNRHKNCEDCEDFLNNYEVNPPIAEIATTEILKESFFKNGQNDDCGNQITDKNKYWAYLAKVDEDTKDVMITDMYFALKEYLNK